MPDDGAGRAALNEGRFSPDMAPPPASFDGLRAQLDEARAALEKVGLEELEEKIGQLNWFADRIISKVG